MNRNNIWIHVGIAVVLITLAAILGQIDRWRAVLKQTPSTVAQKQTSSTTTSGISAAKANRGIPEVLVRFKPGISRDKIRSLTAANEDVVFDKIESVKGLAVIDDLNDADPSAVALQYSAMKDVVEYAEVNSLIKLDDPSEDASARYSFDRPLAADAPNDPLFGDQWALSNTGQDGGTERKDLDALNAWAVTKGSEEVVVAVLDTGVDYKHADLMGNMWVRPANLAQYHDDELGDVDDLHGFDPPVQGGYDPDRFQLRPSIRDTDPMDDNGHGTHCAGIIGAEGDNGIGVSGINQKVQIMPLKFLGRNGSGSTDDAIAAINYAIERKKDGVNLRIISASWGSTARSQALEDVIKAAGDAGILFIAAAGNDGTNNDARPHFPSNYDLPNVISVAALDRNNKLASFSNFGVKTVHIAAPGKEIVSTWIGDNYREASGTSMATPYVSGVAALIIASDPSISMKDLRTRLLDSVDKQDNLKGKVSSGGSLCAANALGNAVKVHLHK
ncbi:MAG TPA: S8 family serine peptidase [Pyrinomonadaceae bacterium]|nr:S8 family serine peptidase [Acidobacteriota bacterium]HQZ95438.1 S8 family serine peptidase [Pyrinomonadaceae bacterium]